MRVRGIDLGLFVVAVNEAQADVERIDPWEQRRAIDLVASKVRCRFGAIVPLDIDFDIRVGRDFDVGRRRRRGHFEVVVIDPLRRAARSACPLQAESRVIYEHQVDGLAHLQGERTDAHLQHAVEAVANRVALRPRPIGLVVR